MRSLTAEARGGCGNAKDEKGMLVNESVGRA